jgi:outer membrane protein, multidrug efflux system
MGDCRKKQIETMARRYILSAFSVALLALTGCMVGPNFKPPQSQVPATWTEQTTATASGATAIAEPNLAEWWSVFGDSTLTSLIDRAAKFNLDLKQAESRIDQARASRTVAAAGLWPAVNLTGSATRSRTPGTAGGSTGASSTGTGGSGSSTGGSKSSNKTVGIYRNLFQYGLSGAWALDIFGGIRRSVEASDADIRAAEEDRRDVMVTLASEVALAYIDLRGFQAQIDIARKNLDAQRHSAYLTRQRFVGGFVGALDVSNAESLVKSTEAQIPVLETSARQSIYSLSVLLGSEPSALLADLSTTASIPLAPPDVPAGIPSELLRRRPDIRRAEAQIHSATARVGVATADLFPKVTLNGSFGLGGSKTSNLTEWANRSWTVGPSATWPVFDAGSIRANIKVQEALEKQSLLAYQKTVLTALQDVENALIASKNEQKRHKSVVEEVAANRKAVELSILLYSQGETDFLNVLTAQRALLASENDLTQSTLSISTDLVTLYKALGGGWEDESNQ